MFIKVIFEKIKMAEQFFIKDLLLFRECCRDLIKSELRPYYKSMKEYSIPISF